MENDLNEIKNELFALQKKAKDLSKAGKTEMTPDMSLQIQKIRGLHVAIILKAMHEHYRESENPLFAWEAFHLCKDSDIKIPGWVLDYFYTSAVNLLKIDKVVGGKVAPVVSSALGMSRRGVFARHKEFKEQLHGACLAIKMKKLNPGRKILLNIYDTVGDKFNVDCETIKQWVRRYRKYAELIVDIEIATGVLIKYTPGYPMMFLYNPPK